MEMLELFHSFTHTQTTHTAPSHPSPYQEEDSPTDPTNIYHCSTCNFDVCVQCFKGHLHPFHTHRLRKARPSLVYTDTDGQWKCDACQSVFAAETYDTTYHCSKCEVDLCESCFSGSLRHSLHKHHMLSPMDPRILYRTHLSWTCDNCSQTFTATSSELFFHCSQCQFDLCTQCFRGDKHHLHQHRLVPLPLAKQTMTCSNCHRQPASYQCTDDMCGYTMCRYCHVIKPKPHPLHSHALELCDGKDIYPQSGGLWHCDNCTRHRGQQTPLSPREPMYHCYDCDFDLCENCYSRGLSPTYGQRPYQYEPYPSLTLLPPSHSTHTLCLVCAVQPATLRCVHGFRACTDLPIICQSCASEMLVYNKPCPYCKEIPNRVEDIRS